MKEFEQLLLDCMIDHRHTSTSHPAANGLSERCVATTKRALSKLCAERGSQLNWDLQLPWVMLGYNASTQAATGFSPYQLMHAVTPTVPPAVRERLLQPADWDGSAAAAADFLARSKLVKERCVMAGDNLRIAQHRDTLRYAKLRSGRFGLCEKEREGRAGCSSQAADIEGFGSQALRGFDSARAMWYQTGSTLRSMCSMPPA